jgi:hypothetical protein
MSFDAKKYLMKVSGKDYLPVAARIMAFREEHPDWDINTAPVDVDTEKGYAIFRTDIFTPEGKHVSSGTKMETVKGFGDYVEKAETGSIGRALAAAGYGTAYATELDEGERIVDSPQGQKQEFICVDCGESITAHTFQNGNTWTAAKVAEESKRLFDVNLCFGCGDKRAKEAKKNGNGKSDPEWKPNQAQLKFLDAMKKAGMTSEEARHKFISDNIPGKSSTKELTAGQCDKLTLLALEIAEQTAQQSM